MGSTATMPVDFTADEGAPANGKLPISGKNGARYAIPSRQRTASR